MTTSASPRQFLLSRANSAACVIVLLVAIRPVAGWAACQEGATQSCTSNGCPGTRECMSGRWSPCECTGAPASCTVCGRSGTKTCNYACGVVSNTCLAPEICNGCDDNQNGMVDDGLYKCATGPFTQAACPAYPTVVPYRFTAPGTVPAAAYSGFLGSVYANNVDHSWRLFANPNVHTVCFNVADFQVDPSGTDRWVFDGANYSGYISTGYSICRGVAGTVQSGVPMRFVTDSISPAPGMRIEFNGLKVYCSGTHSYAPTALTQSVRHEGILLTTGDTLFFTIQGGAEDIFVWTTPRDDASSADIDLYVRTGSMPTKNEYSFRSAGTTSNEAIRITGNTTGQTHYIAVTSHSGQATFGLRFSRAKSNHIIHQRVGTFFTATPTKLAELRAMIKNNMTKFFGATEGQIAITSATLYNSTTGTGCDCGPAGCHVCIRNTPAGSPVNTECVAGLITLNMAEHSDTQTLAHEWGHCTLALLDEYNVHPPGGCHDDILCGHSMMANIHVNNLCTNHNHKLDTSPSGHVCNSCSSTGVCGNSCASCQFNFGSNWGALNSLVSSPEYLTPDNERYLNHSGLNALFVVN